MPLINFSGIASGIDSEGLIAATSDAARAVRVRPSETKIGELEETNSALEQLKSLLRTLQDELNSLSTLGNGVLSKRATSSDETTVTASASGAASNGAYSLTVNQLARGHTLSIASAFTYTSPSDTIVDSGVGAFSDTLTIKVGSPTPIDTIDIDITETTTLNDFISDFNGQTTAATASVVNVGTSGSPDYRILIKSTKTGEAEGEIYWDAGEFSALEALSPASFSVRTEESAQDATFSLTGISGTITRPTNTVTDLIPGLSFSLKGEGGPTTITVADDVSATTAVIQEFVDAYNEVVAFVNENNQIIRQQDGENVSNTFLPLSLTRVDDNAITSIRAQISAAAYFNTGDSLTADNEIRIFAELGITTQSDPFNATTRTGGGTLSFNAQTFASAIAKEPDSVTRIIQSFADAVGRQTGVIQEYIGFNKILDLSINSNRNQISDLNDRIAQAEAAILQQESLMRQRFARLEATIGRLQSQQGALTSALASLPSAS